MRLYGCLCIYVDLNCVFVERRWKKYTKQMKKKNRKRYQWSLINFSCFSFLIVVWIAHLSSKFRFLSMKTKPFFPNKFKFAFFFIKSSDFQSHECVKKDGQSRFQKFIEIGFHDDSNRLGTFSHLRCDNDLWESIL